jgi:hypothetical protein
MPESYPQRTADKRSRVITCVAPTRTRSHDVSSYDGQSSRGTARLRLAAAADAETERVMPENHAVDHCGGTVTDPEGFARDSGCVSRETP